MSFIAINPQRISYMLKLFGLEKDDFLLKISGELKSELKEEDIFSEQVQLSHLKRVDKLFNKGLSFYTSPVNLLESNRDASIFFRKNNFNSDLSLGARIRVNKIEEKIHEISSLSKLANYSIPRKLPSFSIENKANKVAQEVRSVLHPKTKTKNPKLFLEKFIDKLSENNILVHEFVEQWNAKYKSELDGFFIKPNHIALNRNQKALRREIFTLAHELGHYLLESEEIDKIRFDQEDNDIENWCNEFAFHFLVNEENVNKIINLSNPKYDNEIVKNLSDNTHVSRLAIFTHLATNNIITWQTYKRIKADIQNEFNEQQNKIQLQRELDKANGVKSIGGGARPIVSRLEKDIYVSAFFEGAIEEHQLMAKLNKNKKKSLEEIIYE